MKTIDFIKNASLSELAGFITVMASTFFEAETGESLDPFKVFSIFGAITKSLKGEISESDISKIQRLALVNSLLLANIEEFEKNGSE